MGGVPVYRSKRTSLVDQIVQKIKASRELRLAVTPEGTRSANPEWKKGFYYMALGANIPIVLAGYDYRKKCVAANKVIIPAGDIGKDMQRSNCISRTSSVSVLKPPLVKFNWTYLWKNALSFSTFNYQLTPLPFSYYKDKSPDILSAMPIFTSHDIQANYCVKQDYYQ